MYLRKKGPIGSAYYIGPRLGDGPTFKVSVLQLDTKECPGKLPMDLHNSIVATATIDHSLIQAVIYRERGWPDIGLILHHVSLLVAILSGRGYNH